MAGRKKRKPAQERSATSETEPAALGRKEPAAIDAREEIRRNMMRSIVTEPLLSNIRARPDDSFDVIISLNEFYQGGMAGALAQVEARAKAWAVTDYSSVSNYVFARLSGARILQLAVESQELNAQNRREDAVVYRIWEDSEIGVTLTRSVTTVKADAAQRAFQALGEGIVWAVLDSGIAGDHPHFTAKQTPHGRVDALGIRAPVQHRDYTPDGRAQSSVNTLAATGSSGTTTPSTAASALTDRLGHGSHVAGIIGGSWSTDADGGRRVVGTEVHDERVDAVDDGTVRVIVAREALLAISGVAPLCKLVSLKVIADVTRTDEFKQTQGQGRVSWVLRAIEDIQAWNQNGKRLLIHGVNMSLGYAFDPRWFACGQSPLCAEVNRLVNSGVSVVVSAGNGGYSSYITGAGKEENSYNALSITDPGNAELAITVGSTHRDMPHTYGVSYFSSRGPTGDGRRKPDLLAPGERIRSCAAGREAERYGGAAVAPVPTVRTPGAADAATAGVVGAAATAPGSRATTTAEPMAQVAAEVEPVLYCEQTGTSMAAPHVSGAVAAFLSVRNEFIGQPERVKALFLASAIDLGREPTFQGSGLLDLMKVLQSV